MIVMAGKNIGISSVVINGVITLINGVMTGVILLS